MTGPILVFGNSGQVAGAIRAVARGRDLAIQNVGRDGFDLLSDNPEHLIGRLKPAGVINASAYTAVDRAESEPEQAFRLNSAAPTAMARACASLGIPFVHISTDYVFGGDKPSSYVETDPVGPLSVYGRSKAEGEAEVMGAGGAWTIFRTAWVVEPGRANFVSTMRALAAEREVVRVVDDQIGRPTLATDIAAMCLTAVEHARSGDEALFGLFHFAGADDATWADVAEYVFRHHERATGRRPRLERITTAEYPTPARRPANSRLDTTKLERAVDWRPRPWRETVDICLD